ncbi:hypothetical protein L1987_26608 [Smallanthus sonchifolius]|uniref:Uncharacterized protein n=1 Tax=Smallanthus sonchifolius TaxID=185202 RepID=A0ACB9IAH5_9ASTR|nr:hypothetical protein L1987_26608 [Smallanthus sonchifolius]
MNMLSWIIMLFGHTSPVAFSDLALNDVRRLCPCLTIKLFQEFVDEAKPSYVAQSNPQYSYGTYQSYPQYAYGSYHSHVEQQHMNENEEGAGDEEGANDHEEPNPDISFETGQDVQIKSRFSLNGVSIMRQDLSPSSGLILRFLEKRMGFKHRQIRSALRSLPVLDQYQSSVLDLNWSQYKLVIALSVTFSRLMDLMS